MTRLLTSLKPLKSAKYRRRRLGARVTGWWKVVRPSMTGHGRYPYQR